MKILNFGSCNIDYVYSVDHMVQAGETISAEKMEVFAGGKGLNQSIAAARAGAEVYHAGCIGTDGDFLRDLLKKSGADVTYLKQEDIKNGHAIIQVDTQGENSIVIYKGSNGVITEAYIDEVLSHFTAEDFLLLQNEINNLPYLIRKAAEKGMKIVLNPSPLNETISKIDLNDLYCLILNRVEATGFSNTDSPEGFIADMQERYPNLKIVLTLGKNGAIYADRTQTVFCPAFKVTAVDTTAAGDTFTGYLLSLLTKGADYAKALRLAAAASAIAVSKMGAAPSIPTMDMVKHALEKGELK